MYERTHPVIIIQNLWRVFFLIIIPVLRGFILALQGDLAAWASGAWADILVLMLMISIAVLQWGFRRCLCDDEAIRLRAGVLFKKETAVLWRKVTTASIVEPFYLRPFGAVMLRVETLGGKRRAADISVFLNKNRAGNIIYAHTGKTGASVSKRYLPGTVSILSLCILTSNSFAGIVFITTFVSQSGKLLGQGFSNMLIYAFEDIARSFAFGIPPAAAAMAFALMGGWFIGFLLAFIKYRHFMVVRRDSYLKITGGAATKRTYSISCDKVGFIDIRQNIAAIILKLYSLYIYAVGYGKHKDDISCIIPAVKANEFTAARQILFPEFILANPEIKSPAAGIMKFVLQPLIPIIMLPAAIAVLIRLYPLWAGFIQFTGIMLMVPCAVFMAVRVIAFKTGGIAKRDKIYTIRYSTWFSLHTVVMPEDKIALVNLKQSVFQAYGRHNTCDAFIYPLAENERPHICRNLPKKAVEGLFDRLYFNPE